MVGLIDLPLFVVSILIFVVLLSSIAAKHILTARIRAEMLKTILNSDTGTAGEHYTKFVLPNDMIEQIKKEISDV